MVLQMLDQLPSGPIMAKVPRIIKVPEGEAWVETENPLGQMGYYVVSKGATGPFRVKIRSASFSNVSILPWLLRGRLRPRRHHDPRVAVLHPGGHRPVISGRTRCSALEIGWGTTLAIKTVIVLALIPAGALILGYTFLLKVMSHMQSRLGPMDPGGFHGWYQLVGDGLKFLQKEDIMPAKADRRVFALAPAVVVISTFLVFLVIPAGPDLVVKDLDVGVFYALAVSSLSVVGVLMAGLGEREQVRRCSARCVPPRSSSPTSCPLLLADGRRRHPGRDDEPQRHRQRPAGRIDLRLQRHSASPTSSPSSSASHCSSSPRRPSSPRPRSTCRSRRASSSPATWSSTPASGSSSSSSASSVPRSRSPHSPRRSSSAGTRSPGVYGDWANILGPFVLFAKLMLVAFLMFWVRFTYPRLREDQLQAIAWKYLIPIGLANILLTGAFKVAF